MLPAGQRERYAREFVAELHGMPRSRQLRHSLNVLACSWALRTALSTTNAPSPEETIMTTTARRPWPCRLRRHRWDDRQNPETAERYEICLRCDAYRDRPAAAPGAGFGIGSGGGV
ncbi:hypothetical protein [uncultured Friedmanniella sp.]|uniref:hypothetical protein n=1 Tax=uncultured Friedmanniella sp. TaxID=335381 RepID=UPI0035CB19AD